MASNPNAALVPADFGLGADRAALMALDPNWTPDTKSDLAAGVRSSFAIVTYKGKVWGLRFGGETRKVTREDGDPAASLEVVIVRASPHISKTFYKGKYKEGDDSPPDCFSMDGIKPSNASPDKQCETCALCPNNIWGSATNEMGNKTKACSDSRRIAVVPKGDIANEAFGGPMLLRIPPASLNNAAKYGKQVDEVKFPLHGIVTKIGFDQDQAYPSLVFKAIEALKPDDFRQIMAMRETEQVRTILFDDLAAVASAGTPTPAAPSEAVAGLVGAVNPAVAVQPAAETTKPLEAEDPAEAIRRQIAALEAQAKAAEAGKPDAAAEAARVQAEAQARAAQEEMERKAAEKAERARKKAEKEAAAAAEAAKAEAEAKAQAVRDAQARGQEETEIERLQRQLAELQRAKPAQTVVAQPAVQAQTVATQPAVQAAVQTQAPVEASPMANTGQDLDDLLAGIAGV